MHRLGGNAQCDGRTNAYVQIVQFAGDHRDIQYLSCFQAYGDAMKRAPVLVAYHYTRSTGYHHG